MALEREILARIQEAIDSGDNTQQELYSLLLGNVVYLESKGLRDSSELLAEAQQPQILDSEAHEQKYTRQELPALDDPDDEEFAKKLNAFFRDLSDNAPLKTVFMSNEYEQLRNETSINYQNMLTRSLNGVGREIFHVSYLQTDREQTHTIGEIRQLTLTELIQLRYVSRRSALILLHGVQPREDLLTT